MSYTSPYENQSGRWVRGSFHGHCSENSRCASVPLAESVRMYKEAGAGFVTLTDHDVITDLSGIQAEHPEMVFVPGFEYSTRENVVFAGPGVTPLYTETLEDAVREAKDLLTIVAHPLRYQDRDYWTRPMLEALGTMPDGTEVYNGHYGIESALASGRWPLYTSFWDELLTAGHRLWGYANDDFHDPVDFGNAYNMVLVDDLTPESVIASAKAGQCYATTGLLPTRIEAVGGQLNVEVGDVCDGRFVGQGGDILQETSGTTFGYSATDEPYVRFEAEGEKGRLFLQPTFRNP